MILRGRVAIVAGVGPELGRSIALRLAREGANLVLGGLRTEVLRTVASEARSHGARVLEASVDVSKAEDCRRLLELTLDDFGRVDVLVNNVVHRGSRGEEIARSDLSDWQASFQVDFFGSLRLTQVVIPPMREAGSGSIVMIGALETRLAAERMGALPIARGALMLAAQTLARELGPAGIRVNTVVPGYIDGPRLQSALEERAKQEGVTFAEVRARLVTEHALGRLTDASDVADAVLFFASDLSRIVTGQSLDVNCGHYFH